MNLKQIKEMIKELKNEFKKLSVTYDYDRSEKSYTIFVDDLQTYLSDSFQDFISEKIGNEFLADRMPNFSFLYLEKMFEPKNIDNTVKDFIDLSSEQSSSFFTIPDINFEELFKIYSENLKTNYAKINLEKIDLTLNSSYSPIPSGPPQIWKIAKSEEELLLAEYNRIETEFNFFTNSEEYSNIIVDNFNQTTIKNNNQKLMN